MSTFKKCLPDVLAVILFVVLSFAYFFPADTEGRILYRHDSAAGVGFGRDASEYNKQTGDICRWTNSAFCGMPTYQSAPSYKSMNTLHTVADLVARLCVVPIRLYARILYSAPCIRLPSDTGCIGLGDMGIQYVFLDYHCRRSLLESDGIGLSSSDDCRSHPRL